MAFRANRSSRTQGVCIALTILVFMMGDIGCKNEPAANGEGRDAPALNLFTEILQFPDRDASKHAEPVRDQLSREPVKFAERYARLYEERVAKMGGRPPLEGPEKLRFEKEMMLVQAGLIFDMRLGAEHPSKGKFLDIVAWTFEKRQPILEKRKPYIMAKTEAFRKAEELDFKLHEELLVEVRKKLKAAFSPKDYDIITGGM
ncbi:MAG: hypothetical protein KBA61_04970 [Spirochaetes bacterium]|nr:hypothetical protein [Spirochaetota bacterium]